MYPRGEFKKKLISNRAKAASNVEGNGHEGWAFCLSTCGRQCTLWAGSWELLHSSPCPALQSLRSVAQCSGLPDSTWKSPQTSVRYLASEGTTLNYLHTLLDVKLTVRGKKSKRLGIIMDTSSRTSALYRALGWKRKEISSPAQMISGFTGALGRIVFVRPSFHSNVHVWRQLTGNRWHELAAWNPVYFPAHLMPLAEVTPYKTESLKASLLGVMMMKVQNDLKLNRNNSLCCGWVF